MSFNCKCHLIPRETFNGWYFPTESPVFSFCTSLVIVQGPHVHKKCMHCLPDFSHFTHCIRKIDVVPTELNRILCL